MTRRVVRPIRFVPLVLPAAAVLLFATGLEGLEPQQQIPGAFRSRVVVVPVDVHVVDGDGRAVTDLTAEDFTILENGRPQPIAHFSRQILEPDPPPSEAGGPAFRQPRGEALAPLRQRIFLIFLGRGRLQYPAAGVDGVIEFVRERALPQDQIAVMAWNRATAFTTDHARILEVLGRFLRGHEKIEAYFAEQDRSLAAIYGTGEIPPKIQKQIDDIFEGAGSRALLQDPLANTNQVTAVQRQTIGDLMRNDLLSQRTGPELTDAFVESVSTDSGTFGLDQYLQASAESVFDLGNLFKAIAYLRYLEGEKRLIFVSEHGLFLPQIAGNSGIAAAAADARVAIDTIHTGGMSAYGNASLVASSGSGAGPLRSVADEVRAGGAAIAASSYFRVRALRDISDYTGGIASAYRKAIDGLERVDGVTRTSYLLGYYPRDESRDGRYRRLEVKVNRPGVRVFSRGGYYARDEIVTTNRREFLTYTRIAAAGGYDRDAPDIKIDLNVTADPRAKTVTVELTVDPEKLSFEDVNGRHATTLDVAIFCGDERRDIVGELWRKVDLSFTDQTFARLNRERLAFSVTVPVERTPRFVKAVVYDYGADLVGSRVAVMR